jgi:hypothetical protein
MSKELDDTPEFTPEQIAEAQRLTLEIREGFRVVSKLTYPQYLSARSDFEKGLRTDGVMPEEDARSALQAFDAAFFGGDWPKRN